MVTIRLTNSKTRRKEVFAPFDPTNVRMYVCGLTVYDRAHIGNARPVIVFDVLNRLLRHVYGPQNVTYVRNFTDVDDKINAEALRRQKAGSPGSLEELIRERTDETIAWYHADTDALGALRPAIRDDRTPEGLYRAEPRATEWIGAMIMMTAELIAKGHAYPAAGHVLFRVRSYKDYGKLSGRSVDDMIAGARVEVAPFKEDPMDFVLWKPSSGQEPGWDSPWGRGRPGWHIECSAMAHELLGESFDIHGGGLDLQFPHHENEIAQSACAHPHGQFARYWLHNEMLQVEGKKMSKSLGNFFTVRDLLDQGVPGEVIRFVFLMTHYRSPMDWTAEKAAQALGTLGKWASLVQDIDPTEVDSDVLEALANDLNTSMAISRMHALYSDGDAGRLRASANLLGLLTEAEKNWAEPEGLTQRLHLARDLANHLGKKMHRARAARDFVRSDAIRARLVELGVEVQIDSAGVTTQVSASADRYFSPEKGQLQPRINDGLEVLTRALKELDAEYE
jgi:cysteinyl-tRNA synthetase